jgi:hypothetical protein
MSNIDLINKLPDSIYAINLSSNNYKLWKIFASQMDELDEAFRTMQSISDARNNFGAQLDILGKIIRCFRRGQGDARYIERMLATMRKYQSNGSIEELNIICEILLGEDFKYIKGSVLVAQCLDGSRFLDGRWFLSGDIIRPRYFEVIVSNNLDDEMMDILTDVVNSCKAGGIKFAIRKEG